MFNSTMAIFVKLYFLCCVLRIILIFVPQNGYIHPDEFFQSLEVAVGDAFNVQHKQTWEFNSTMPIRSWAPIFILVKLPLLSLSQAASSYSVLVVSRLPTTILSFANDFFVYLLAKRAHVTPLFLPLFIYAFSYTTLIHMTHTLSNSWESSILSLIGCLILISLRNGTNIITNCILFTIEAGLLAFGFFCRPTILLFAVPYLLIQFYLLTCILRRILFGLLFPIAFLISSFILVYFDSLHYHHEKSAVTIPSASIISTCFPSMQALSACLIKNKISITPLNFLFYNFNNDNLSQHGRHPWYTHMIINMPQLFGPFYFLGLLTPMFIIKMGNNRKKKEFKFQISQRKASYLLVFCVLFPLLGLSSFCHQEARFLLPLVTLWSVLSAISFQHYTLSQFDATSASLNSFRLLSVWFVYNLIASIFWGFLHQGGVVKSMLHLPVDSSSCNALVFYRTYMPPESLLLRPVIPTSQSVFRCNQVHDLAGSHESAVVNYLIDLIRRMKTNPSPYKFLYLTFPYSGVPDFTLTNSSIVSIFETEYDSVYDTFGHFSGENPPDFYPYSWPDLVQVWSKWRNQLTLATYRFKIL